MLKDKRGVIFFLKRLEWQIVFLSIFLVIAPIIFISVQSYNTYEKGAFSQAEDDLKNIANDWNILTRSYVMEEERILKREEFLYEKRLESIALDVYSMLKIMHGYHGDESSNADIDFLLEEASNVETGRTGSVFILDSNGDYHLLDGEINPESNLYDFVDKSKYDLFSNYLERFSNLDKGEVETVYYNGGLPESRDKVASFVYFKPHDFIIGVGSYISDFKSSDLEDRLKDELIYQMTDQEIGEKGYIWVVDSEGNYIVSKDSLRNGENIYDYIDKDGTRPIQDIINNTISLSEGEFYSRHYNWRNPGEEEALLKVSTCNYVPEWDWIICASAYYDDFLQNIGIIKNNIVIISLITLLFSLIIAVAASVLLYNPIKKLEKVSVDIARGKLDSKVDKKLLNANTEIGNLAKSIDFMLERLVKEIDSQKSISSDLKSSRDELERQNKRLKELDNMKINFLNMVTHELKTPLTAIIAYLDILEDSRDHLTKEDIQGLDTIKRNSKQLSGLIGNILEVARIESGKFELTLVSMEIKKKIDEVVDNLKIIADNKKIKLSSSLSNIPEKITTDEQRFEEILNNLLSNAIKFTDKGEVKVEASQKGDMIEVIVSDTGVGISKQNINKLFHDFYQVDSSISRKYGGTGLGLSITKKLIELQGGNIRVESQLGRGSKFIFTLPVNQVQKKSTNVKSKKKTLTEDDFNKMIGRVTEKDSRGEENNNSKK